jgi:putative ABC transport system permease protein
VPASLYSLGFLRPSGNSAGFQVDICSDWHKYPISARLYCDMVSTINIIPWTQLALVMIPVALVALILHRWSLGTMSTFHGVARMLLQLILMGYVLNTLFASDQPAIMLAVLGIMLLAAAWIALRPLQTRSRAWLGRAILALGLGSLSTLVLVMMAVLKADRWYNPQQLIPIGGMIFTAAMNAVSLAAERFERDQQQLSYIEARNQAMNTAMIPMVNSLFAVGLVSLPGMMTGQILSGVDPLVAVRYQIMVMAMTFGASGISAAVFLALLRPRPPQSPSAPGNR